MNDLSMLRIEWAKLCLKNSSEKVKIVKIKWHLNLGHNKIAITGKQDIIFILGRIYEASYVKTNQS